MNEPWRRLLPAKRATAGAQTWSSVIMSLPYLATFVSFIGFSAVRYAVKTQFPDVQILHYAFFGPFIGALARLAGAIFDRLGDAYQLCPMAIFAVCCS